MGELQLQASVCVRFINMVLSDSDSDRRWEWATHTAYITLKSVQGSTVQHVFLEAEPV